MYCYGPLTATELDAECTVPGRYLRNLTVSLIGIINIKNGGVTRVLEKYSKQS